MAKLIDELFLESDLIAPSNDLLGMVLQRIQNEKNKLIRRIKVAFGFFSFMTLGALCFLVPVFSLFQTEMNQSSFGEFLALLQSDFSLVAAEWQDYFFSLLESLPFLSFISFFAVIFVILFSFKSMIHFYYLLKYNQFSL